MKLLIVDGRNADLVYEELRIESQLTGVSYGKI